MGTYDVLRVEKVGKVSVKLTRLEGRYRVLVITEPSSDMPYEIVFAVKRTYRTAEVAGLAFDFMVAFHRTWAPLSSGRPVPEELMRAAREAGEALNAAGERLDDYPPETATEED